MGTLINHTSFNGAFTTEMTDLQLYNTCIIHEPRMQIVLIVLVVAVHYFGSISYRLDVFEVGLALYYYSTVL